MSQLLPLVIQIHVCGCSAYEKHKHIVYHILNLITTYLFTFAAVKWLKSFLLYRFNMNSGCLQLVQKK